MYECWIQASDFSSKSLGVLDADQAVEAFGQIDMGSYDGQMMQLAEKNKDWCPWGFGIMFEDGRLFHAYREDSVSGSFEVLVSKPKQKKFLGLIPYESSDSKTVIAINADRAADYISKALTDFDALFESA